MRYGGGSLAVDHASKKIFIHHQVSLRAADMLVAKHLLERDACAVGIQIKHYYANNGIFAWEEFKQDCKLKEQMLTFSAANSYSQNGVAEQYIGAISRMAQAMLIHSALLWLWRHDLKLWPMAMDYVVWFWNNLPMEDGMNPKETWTSTKAHNYDHLCRAHVFSCPCYVLNPKFVEGQKILKWDPCLRQGKFVGYSKDHATTAGLVLNLTTHCAATLFCLILPRNHQHNRTFTAAHLILCATFASTESSITHLRDKHNTPITNEEYIWLHGRAQENPLPCVNTPPAEDPAQAQAALQAENQHYTTQTSGGSSA